MAKKKESEIPFELVESVQEIPTSFDQLIKR